MKKYLFFIFIILIPLACETDDHKPVYREDLVGSWVNVTNEIDTLYISFHSLRRIQLDSDPYITPGPNGYLYHYKIDNDSIILRWRPFNDILGVGDFTCQIRFLDENYQFLSINDLSQMVPRYPGTEFRRVDSE